MRRFTDTEKWSDPWFRSLRAAHKLIFLFIIDRCDNAGFYEVDIDSMMFHTGLKREHIEAAWEPLSRGIIQGKEGYVWVKNFLFHQRNDQLDEKNLMHRQIIALLKQHVRNFKDCDIFRAFIAPYKGLIGVPGNIEGKGNVRKHTAEQKKQAEEIYAAYPKKAGKPKAIQAILKALDKTNFEVLLERTKQYALARQGKPDFTPYPASWFNAERYNDDPSTWGSAELKPAEKPKLVAKDWT